MPNNQSNLLAKDAQGGGGGGGFNWFFIFSKGGELENFRGECGSISGALSLPHIRTSYYSQKNNFK